MNKKVLALWILVVLPIVTNASFNDIYSTRTERLLGNPTALYDQMQTFTTYGQKTTLEAAFTSSAEELFAFPSNGTNAWYLHLTSDIIADKQNNLAGTIAIQASGSIDGLSDSGAGEAELVITDGTIFVKPTITQLPENVPSEQQVGFQLLDGKRIQLNETWTTQGVSLPTVDSVAVAKELVEVVHTTPVLKSTKSLTRNGYEIHVVQVDTAGIEKLLAWVVNTVVQQTWTPLPMSTESSPTNSIKSNGLKTIGVIGKKWDEIKMGLIVKDRNEPVGMLLSSISTSSTSSLKVNVSNRHTKEAIFTLGIQQTTPSISQRSMDITFWALEDKVTWTISLNSTVYNAGNQQITAPTGAILLQDIMQTELP